ncbi:hypothetical protein AXG93_4324s1090 [Marchantia polymorpha subsp. ruderalis]|uniref:Uncharacterized protein n=1 Tax=Marchantia polymorpha subsp. ruderalis TaxID=1480154 RepID=A0A176W155_MARPO|nr:hypothetical protein AXG93_4324s1090 [Marchantia polymorpha subsp. ruderalis]
MALSAVHVVGMLETAGDSICEAARGGNLEAKRSSLSYVGASEMYGLMSAHSKAKVTLSAAINGASSLPRADDRAEVSRKNAFTEIPVWHFLVILERRGGWSKGGRGKDMIAGFIISFLWLKRSRYVPLLTAP